MLVILRTASLAIALHIFDIRGTFFCLRYSSVISMKTNLVVKSWRILLIQFKSYTYFCILLSSLIETLKSSKSCRFILALVILIFAKANIQNNTGTRQNLY